MQKKFLAFLLVLLCCASAFAEDSAVKKAIQPFIDSGAMPGVVSILSSDGRLQIDCMGWANVEKQVPISENSFFWIASMTKGITAAAFVMLVDEGKVSLEDPVEKYLPEFRNVRAGVKNEDGSVTLRAPKSKMTLRQVLSHTAGFTFITPQMQQFGIDVFSMRHLASTAVNVPLLCEPGTEFHYSNVGIDVAAAVMEVVTGKSLEENLQERIFDPLGMTETTFHPTPEQLSRLVSCYAIQTGKCVPAQTPFLQTPYDAPSRCAEAGGGLFSTPLDVMKFYRMLASRGVFDGKRILSENAFEIFTKKQTPDSVSEPYALGMWIRDSWLGHGGALGTDAKANFLTNQVWLFFVQIEGTAPCKDAWLKAAGETPAL